MSKDVNANDQGQKKGKKEALDTDNDCFRYYFGCHSCGYAFRR